MSKYLKRASVGGITYVICIGKTTFIQINGYFFNIMTQNDGTHTVRLGNFEKLENYTFIFVLLNLSLIAQHLHKFWSFLCSNELVNCPSWGLMYQVIYIELTDNIGNITQITWTGSFNFYREKRQMCTVWVHGKRSFLSMFFFGIWTFMNCGVEWWVSVSLLKLSSMGYV